MGLNKENRVRDITGSVRDVTLRGRKTWHEVFLKALAKTANTKFACEAANISRPVAYADRKNIPEFAARWKVAINDAIDALELEAHRRAHDGYEKPVFYKGVLCGHIREYSDALLIHLLKSSRPKKHREPSQFNVAQSTTVAQPVVIKYEDFDAESDLKASRKTETIPQQQ